MREAVKWFAEKMEEQLKENDFKGGWRDDAVSHLFHELCEEIGELGECLIDKDSSINIVEECADAANYIMMIADRHRDY